jgi:tryptophan-rich hypothetical protein
LTIAEAWGNAASFQKLALLISKIRTLSLPPHQEHFIAKPRNINAVHSKKMNRLNPKKLLLSKWTAVQPIAKQKHFLVSKVVLPEDASQPIEWVEIEAVYSKQTKQIPWKELKDSELWIQGWK